MDMPEGILMNFPSTKVEGCTVLGDDGYATVILNARCANNRCIKAYRHEVEHIKSDDFRKCDVQQIEADAHDTK